MVYSKIKTIWVDGRSLDSFRRTGTPHRAGLPRASPLTEDCLALLAEKTQGIEDCGLGCPSVQSHWELFASSTATSGGRGDSHEAMVLAACPGQQRHSVTTYRQGPQLSVPHHRLQQDGPARPHRSHP